MVYHSLLHEKCACVCICVHACKHWGRELGRWHISGPLHIGLAEEGCWFTLTHLGIVCLANIYLLKHFIPSKLRSKNKCETRICPETFIAALFVIFPNWKQLRCHLVNGCVPAMESYFATKRNTLLHTVMSTYITLLKWQNCRDEEPSRVCQGSWAYTQRSSGCGCGRTEQSSGVSSWDPWLVVNTCAGSLRWTKHMNECINMGHVNRVAGVRRHRGPSCDCVLRWTL